MKNNKTFNKIKKGLIKTVKILLSVVLSLCIVMSVVYGTFILYKNSVKGDMGSTV